MSCENSNCEISKTVILKQTSSPAVGAAAAGSPPPPARCFKYSSNEGAAEMDLRYEDLNASTFRGRACRPSRRNRCAGSEGRSAAELSGGRKGRGRGDEGGGDEGGGDEGGDDEELHDFELRC